MKPSFIRILQILFRRRWIVVNVWVVTVAVIVTASYVLPSVYVASAKFLVIPGNEQLPIFTLSSIVADRVVSTEPQTGDILSEVELLESRPILERVVDRLGLDRPDPKAAVAAEAGASDNFLSRIGATLSDIRAQWNQLLVDLNLVTVASPHDTAIGALAGKIKVEPVRLSDVITVEYSDSNPDRAATIVNALAEEYLAYRRDVYKPVGIVEHFKEKLDQQEADLKVSRERLAAYQDQYGIANLEVETETTIRLLEEAKKNGAFNQLVDQYSRRLATLRTAAPVIRDLRFDVENDQTLYERYLQKYDEVSSNAELSDAKFANVRLIEPATPNRIPVFPHRLLNVYLSMILGLLGGIGLALAMNYFSNKLNTVEDVEAAGVPALGSVPWSARHRRERSATADCSSEAISLIAEQVLRNGSRSGFVLSGAGSRVGCTTVSAGLALAMAKYPERRLLIVEADNQQPRLRQLFRPQESALVARDARHEQEPAQTICPTRYPNIDILMVDSEAARDFDVGAVHALLDNDATPYDVVVVDAPPLLTSGTAFALANGMKGWGVILVLEAGRTSAQVAHRAVELVRRQGIALFGGVLNKREDSLPDFLYRRL